MLWRGDSRNKRRKSKHFHRSSKAGSVPRRKRDTMALAPRLG
jgi:hypothetical protein